MPAMKKTRGERRVCIEPLLSASTIDAERGMTETLQFAGGNSVGSPERDRHPLDSRGITLGLLSFDAAFQSAIRESLRTGAEIDVRSDVLPFAGNDADLPQFCEQALDGCPLKIEIRLLNGRCVQVSLNWTVSGESSSVSVHATDITDHKRAEEEQLVQARQHQDGFDSAVEGVYRTSHEGRLLFANRSLARLLGYDGVGDALSAIEDVRRDLWVNPAERTEYVQAIEQYGSVEGFECRLRRRDGAIFWASLNARKVCGSNGESPYLEGFVQDISDRKASEKKLRDSEERYRASFEQAAVGILHTSFEGRILRCNRRFADILGYAPHELVGLTFQEITPPGDRPPSKSVFQQLVSGSVPNAAFEKRYVRKDGSLTWVMLTITAQRDSDGHPLHFITMVQDINARKEAEQQLAAAQELLRKSEERYRTAFQMTLDAVNLNRLCDGLYVDCNKAFLSLTGYAREEVIGRTSVELSIWADPRDRRQLVERITQDGVCRNLEAQFRRKNGEVLWGLMSASVIELDGGPCVLSITRDISEAKLAENEIKRLAFYDPLTGLPNRRMLLERLRQTLSPARKQGRKRALLFVDLDDFKTLNDSLGHHTGDLLLQEVARRLLLCVRDGDTAARLGGDEFVIMLENLNDATKEAANQAEAVAQQILHVTAEPYLLGDRECLSTASIGITVFGDRQSSTSEILQQADIAMYQAKAAGRNTIRFFAPALQAAVSARACLEDEIRHGIRERQFSLWYQPQVDSGRIIGAEALLRWNHPQRGVPPPAEFIPLAEETGLIIPLGRFVLEQACSQAAAWAGRPGFGPIPIAVNVSARQFRQADFVTHVLESIRRAGANPENIKLEITESMLLDNLEETVAVMNTLKSHGLRFSLDDFGTGYSSLAYLKRLPLDQLKIDRTFVRDILANSTNGALAQAIISLAGALGLLVIAEGVETNEQKELLAHLGCNCFQGYLFSRPVPATEFEALLARAPGC
jgi:diguanylate cyclase (GGDEF)-like protein/PAS domain S-box-containing protein